MVFTEFENQMFEVSLFLPSHIHEAKQILIDNKVNYHRLSPRLQRWYRLLCLQTCCVWIVKNPHITNNMFYSMYGFPVASGEDIKYLAKVYDLTIEAQNCTDLNETFEILKEICKYYPSSVFPQMLRSDYFRKGLWDEGWSIKIPSRPLVIEDFLTNKKDLNSRLNLDKGSLWNGCEDITGKKLLVVARKDEWGYGDQINFCWLYKNLVDSGIDTYFTFDKALEPLMKDSFPYMKFWDGESDFDYYCFNPFALLRYLKINPTTLLRPKSYLKTPSRRIDLNQFETEKRFRVGLCWQASDRKEIDNVNLHIFKRMTRGFNFERLEPFFDLPFNFYSLLPDEQSKELSEKHSVIDLTNYLHDFSDTASVIDQLDLVITVDTAIAHLSGALGKETWVLLIKYNDCRWGYEAENTSFYPSVRLFRQSKACEWDDVIKKVSLELTKLTENPTHLQKLSA